MAILWFQRKENIQERILSKQLNVFWTEKCSFIFCSTCKHDLTKVSLIGHNPYLHILTRLPLNKYKSTSTMKFSQLFHNCFLNFQIFRFSFRIHGLWKLLFLCAPELWRYFVFYYPFSLIFFDTDRTKNDGRSLLMSKNNHSMQTEITETSIYVVTIKCRDFPEKHVTFSVKILSHKKIFFYRFTYSIFSHKHMWKHRFDYSKNRLSLNTLSNNILSLIRRYAISMVSQCNTNSRIIYFYKICSSKDIYPNTIVFFWWIKFATIRIESTRTF